MKLKGLLFSTIIPFLLISAALTQNIEVTECNESAMINSTYSKAAELENVLKQLTESGVPGVSMAVYSEEGMWSTAYGLASIEKNIPMQICHLQYHQSISKIYMSVAILMLYEQGEIDLDFPITHYLPEKYSRTITDAGSITVRMLLNHTSGIPEYNSAPAYVTRLLQRPDYPFTALDYLKYINGKPLTFEPGSRYSYKNTNYVILALIADEITGNHAEYISKNIFNPVSLNLTFYRNDPGYLTYPTLVNSYWDRYSDGVVENASTLQRNNVSSLIGDDGIVSTATDAVIFLKALLSGEIISEVTLKEMKTWVKNRHGNESYGLGLAISQFQDNVAYGHSGGGIGAGSQLYYFPEKNIYVFISINLGTVTESPLHDKAAEILNRLYHELLK